MAAAVGPGGANEGAFEGRSEVPEVAPAEVIDEVGAHFGIWGALLEPSPPWCLAAVTHSWRMISWR